MELGDAENKFLEIYKNVKSNLTSIRTEEDTKIQIINRILNECLGWPYSDFRAESHHENGYSDYILVDNEKPVLLIEAKRMGLLDVKTVEKNKIRHLKISGSSLKLVMSGIDQAANYSLLNGLPISILTDGITWIIFKTFIPGENFKTKEAIVFPSFDAIVSDFSHFFELLSKQQYSKKLYNSIFDGIHHRRLLLTHDLTPPINESNLVLSRKSDIAFDLESVFANFFSTLVGDGDEDMLINCFVETRESRIADFSLEKMTASVLGNLTSPEKNVGTELTSLIKVNVETEALPSESGQTVFIVGPTGAGKSTFLDRFFRKTLPAPIRRKCVLLGVNCLDATGRPDTALDWITEQLISALEKEVYKDGAPNWDDLLGLYHGEYTRRSQGVDAQLYKRDKQEFKEKFGIFLDNKVENDREGYLKRILEDVVNNRKMLPVVLIDNIDEFGHEYKKKFFQFTQALRRHAHHCLVIFPVTDKSAWSFSKTDIFGIYSSRSFFLPTPSPREVFRKRIEYLKQKLSSEGPNKKLKKDYLLSRGIKISIENLSSFAKVLESVFIDHDYTSKTIGELTNYNIRRTLLLSQRIITSSVIAIEDIIKSYINGEPVTTSFSRFMNALMKGDYEAYKQGDNHEIYPVFQADSKIRQSPLLKLRVLALLNSTYEGSRSIEDRHLGVQSIEDYFDSIGCSEVAIENALLAILEAGLIEPYDVSNRDLSNNQKFAITYKGIAHLRLSSHNSVFFYQMALTTAIANPDVSLQIKSMYRSNTPIAQKVEKVMHLFLAYLIHEDNQYISIESQDDKYNCQKNFIANLEKFEKLTSDSEDDLVATHGKEYKEGMVKKGILATVDYFDESKGFGFVETEELDSRIFVHARAFSHQDINTLKDGDEILCDIARGQKGLYVKEIHDIETAASGTETVNCHIVRLFLDRGYGFVQLEGNVRSAFFHVSLFPQETRSELREGLRLNVEICPGKKGTGFQVKQIISQKK